MAGRVYVGNLPLQVVERDLEEQFGKFGTLRSVWVARKPPGFAFVDFEDSRDADDAVRKLDGYQQWRVEISRKGQGGGRPAPRGPPRQRERSLSPVRRRRSPSYSPRRRRRSPSYEPRRRRSPSYEPRPRRSPSYSPRRSLSPIPSRHRSRSRS